MNDAVMGISRALLGFALWHPTTFPVDITPPGGQVPLFIGPCLYCNEGYVPHLPCKCPVCGAELRGVVRIPLWVRGAKTYRVWFRWMWLKRSFKESLPEGVQVFSNLLQAVATVESRRGLL